MYLFLEPDSAYPLPPHFNFNEYLEVERELWALFPETDGRRANFCLVGLTAQLYVESASIGPMEAGETYFLMPCADQHLRPLRMRALRRLTRDEFRLSYHTAFKMGEMLNGARGVLDEVQYQILGS